MLPPGDPARPPRAPRRYSRQYHHDADHPAPALRTAHRVIQPAVEKFAIHWPGQAVVMREIQATSRRLPALGGVFGHLIARQPPLHGHCAQRVGCGRPRGQFRVRGVMRGQRRHGIAECSRVENAHQVARLASAVARNGSRGINPHFGTVVDIECAVSCAAQVTARQFLGKLRRARRVVAPGLGH